MNVQYCHVILCRQYLQKPVHSHQTGPSLARSFLAPPPLRWRITIRFEKFWPVRLKQCVVFYFLVPISASVIYMFHSCCCLACGTDATV